MNSYQKKAEHANKGRVPNAIALLADSGVIILLHPSYYSS